MNGNRRNGRRDRSARRRKTGRQHARVPADGGSLWARHPRLVIFSALYLLLALLGVVVTGNTEFAFYLVSLAIIIASVLWLERRIGFSSTVLWCLSLWGLAHLAGGLMPLPPGWPYQGDHAVWYSGWIIPNWLKYDQVVHAFGFGTAAVATAESIQPTRQRFQRPTSGMSIVCILVACGLGSLNEIIEFIATRLSPETNVGGYVNTALDLVSNFAGATLAMLIIARTRPSA